MVAIRSATLGTILADARDMVLYTYTADAGGRDGCTGACLKYWPPLLLPGGARAAVAGAGVTGLGIVQRPTGAQVTFEGKPLYTYLGDSRPGETSGQGIVDSGGTWYVAVLKAPVAATGTKPAQPAATTSPATPTPATTTPARHRTACHPPARDAGAHHGHDPRGPPDAAADHGAGHRPAGHPSSHHAADPAHPAAHHRPGDHGSRRRGQLLEGGDRQAGGGR